MSSPVRPAEPVSSGGGGAAQVDVLISHYTQSQRNQSQYESQIEQVPLPSPTSYNLTNRTSPQDHLDAGNLVRSGH